MGDSPREDPVRNLRRLHSFKSNGMEGHPFGVCAHPRPRGHLNEEEYASYLAAADGKHDTYMRHGAPWAPSDLAYEVTASNTVVAWLPYDGVPRVIERDFGNADMNRARDLAREHLGADLDAQQRLTDERGDLEHLSPAGFRGVIYEHLDRARRNSEFNDFPTDIPVREYFSLRRAEALAKAENAAPAGAGSGHFGVNRETHVFVPNPTVKYTDQQRREWAAQAAHYLAAYRDRFPADYTLWTTHRHHEAHRYGKKLSPLEVQPGDRVGIMRSRTMTPAILLAVEGFGADLRASVRVEDGEFERVWIRPQNLTPEAELLPETRAVWAPLWEHLAAEDWAPDGTSLHPYFD